MTLSTEELAILLGGARVEETFTVTVVDTSKERYYQEAEGKIVIPAADALKNTNYAKAVNAGRPVLVAYSSCPTQGQTGQIQEH